MRVYLSTPVFDIDGHVEINALPATDLGETSRRMNRVATLDGGAAFNDYGHSFADRTITVNWKTRAPAFEANLSRMVRVHPEIIASTRDGVFLTAPQSYTANDGTSKLILLVKSKMDD
jgi:hypothetical protein